MPGRRGSLKPMLVGHQQQKGNVSRDVCSLVDNGQLQELEDGKFAELAAVGVQGIQEWLAAIEQPQSPTQTVSCTGRRPSDVPYCDGAELAAVKRGVVLLEQPGRLMSMGSCTAEAAEDRTASDGIKALTSGRQPSHN